MNMSPKNDSKMLEKFPTANKMGLELEPLRDLDLDPAHHGCAGVEFCQQLTCQSNSTDRLDLSSTRTALQNASDSTDTQACVEHETSPTTISPTDSFRKGTDTTMGLHDSDSVYSSGSDVSTYLDMQRTESPTKVNTVLVKGIGSHLINGNAGDGFEACPTPLSSVQHEEFDGRSELNEHKYGEQLDGSDVLTAGSHHYSLYVLSRSH